MDNKRLIPTPYPHHTYIIPTSSPCDKKALGGLNAVRVGNGKLYAGSNGNLNVVFDVKDGDN